MDSRFLIRIVSAVFCANLVAFSTVGGAPQHEPADNAVWGEGDCSGDCCCACDPLWRFYTGALFLERSTPDALVLMQATADPTRNLNANDFDFDWRGGYELSLARSLGCDREIEARLMVLDSWNAGHTAVTNATLIDPLQINTDPLLFAPNVSTIDAVYGTDLTSVEVNWLEPACSDWTLHGGFRYVEMDERMQSLLDAAPQTFSYDVATQNRLYGFQAGAGSRDYCVGRWRIDGLVKAGIYYNSVAQASSLSTGVIGVTAAQSSDRAAFLGELGVSGTRDLTDALALRVSYNLMWLEAVAVAGDQIPVTNLVTGNGIAADGGVFLHGATIGLEYRR